MVYRFNDRTINNLSELLSFIEADEMAILGALPEEAKPKFPGIWYRGLPNINYKLQPTFHRNGIAVSDEPHMVNRFKQNAHEFLDVRPQGEWEWMLLMRHHKLLSRLLDWSESPLIGTFFAVNNETNEEEESDGFVWCLLPTMLNSIASGGNIRTDVVLFFDDELTSGQHIADEDLFIRRYLTSVVSREVSTIPVRPAAGMGIRTTKRIQAQHGVFTIHHADPTPIEQVGDSNHVWRFKVPKERKKPIKEELRRLKITDLTVFPELDNVANEAKRGF